MGRPQRDFYSFVYDSYGKYYTVKYDIFGKPSIVKNPSPYPLNYNAANLTGLKVEYGTNKTYFSLTAGMSYPLEMIKDGADLFRLVDYLGNGFESLLFMTIIKYDSNDGIYKKYLSGKIDFIKKKDDAKNNYKVNLIDYSAWSFLSQNDTTQYQIDCSASNDKAIRVLFDGINLVAKYIYQPIVSEINMTSFGGYLVYPMIFVAKDGDSSGVIAQDEELSFTTQDPQTYMAANPANFKYKTQYAGRIVIDGTLQYTVRSISDVPFILRWYFYRSTDTLNPIALPANRIIEIAPLANRNGVTSVRTASINQTFDLVDGESIILGCILITGNGDEAKPFVNPLLQNINITTVTKHQPSVSYCLRPLNLLQALVNKATNGMFTVNSNFFTINNKTVLTCGNALRNAPNAYIKSSVSDWFKSFNSKEFLAFRFIDGNLWVEKAIEVYKEGNVLFDLGEIENLIIENAVDYVKNTIKIGSPKQDYRHSSGRLEFNCEADFSTEIASTKAELDCKSVYRLDGYGADFIILDFQNVSSEDNSGDTTVFGVDILDEQDDAISLVENFVNVEVDHAPLQPIVKYPFTNDSITNDKPRIKGIAPAGQTVNIYVDTVFDGSVVADVNGNWEYVIQTSLTPLVIVGTSVITTGVHTIDATFTDETGALATLKLNIFTGSTNTAITYPQSNDSLYNNKPLIKGVAQFGTVVPIIIDGINVASVTADESCKWEYQSPVLSNANHVLKAGAATLSFVVNSFTDVPIITSFFDGFPIINNMPLVEGVAKPGTVVKLYANYFPGIAIGSTIADINGNWSFQTVPIDEPGTSIPLVPFPNGVNTISTDLTIKTSALNIQAFKLNRPLYSQIQGVLDNSVFNTTISPKRMLKSWYPYLAGMLFQIQNSVITYQGCDKNQSLFTVLTTEDIFINGIKLNGNSVVIGGYIYIIIGSALTAIKIFPYQITLYALTPNVPFIVNGVTFLITNQYTETVKENANISYSELGVPLFLCIYGSFTTKTRMTFDQSLRFFSSGGIITATYLGNNLYFKAIGQMSIDDVTRDVQNWKLLLSPQTLMQTLLNVSRNGIYLSVMQNALYHSDYNPLHFVKYDYSTTAKYNMADIYDNWFNNRNDRWAINPVYIQKFQLTEIIRDQLITNNCYPIFKLWRCFDASLVDTKAYVPISPSPIPLPDICQEVEIDWSGYPEDQYFATISALIKNTNGLTLEVHEQGNEAPNGWYFTLRGTPVAGYKIKIALNISNGAYYVEFIYTVLAGQTIADIIAAIIALIDADINFRGNVSGTTSGGDSGVLILCGDLDTLEGTSTIYTETEQFLLISERVETRVSWPDTILIESRHTTNKIGIQFSTGFMSILRIEGLVQKWSPKIDSLIVNTDEVANNQMLYSLNSKQRKILIGDQSGLPDYLYLKVAAALLLDDMSIEGIFYVADKDNKLEENDRLDGYPMYHYSITVQLRDAQEGITVAAGQNSNLTGATIVVDPSAFGLQGDLQQIQLN